MDRYLVFYKWTAVDMLILSAFLCGEWFTFDAARPNATVSDQNRSWQPKLTTLGRELKCRPGPAIPYLPGKLWLSPRAWSWSACGRRRSWAPSRRSLSRCTHDSRRPDCRTYHRIGTSRGYCKTSVRCAMPKLSLFGVFGFLVYWRRELFFYLHNLWRKGPSQGIDSFFMYKQWVTSKQNTVQLRPHTKDSHIYLCICMKQIYQTNTQAVLQVSIKAKNICTNQLYISVLTHWERSHPRYIHNRFTMQSALARLL